MRDIRNILSVLLLLGLSYSQASVTFQVDMQGQTVHENGVYLMGGPWHSNPQAMEAPDQGETIWSLTLSTDPDGAALSGDYMYKFSNGGDSDYYESLPEGAEATQRMPDVPRQRWLSEHARRHLVVSAIRLGAASKLPREECP